eukprot:15243837-Alexandrium_andersonii.AAC.1
MPTTAGPCRPCPREPSLASPRRGCLWAMLVQMSSPPCRCSMDSFLSYYTIAGIVREGSPLPAETWGL